MRIFRLSLELNTNCKAGTISLLHSSIVYLQLKFIYMKTIYTVFLVAIILLLCYTPPAQSEWHQLTSGSQSYLRGINFAGPLTGYAVGDGILRTDDAGQTWLSVINDTGPFYSAFFISPDTGFSCVPGGYVVETTNGCHTWINGSSMNTFQSLFFTSHVTGFAVGGAGKGPALIGRTVNQGVSWAYQNLGSYGELHSVYFLNTQLGFAAGGYHFTTPQQVLYYSGLIYRTSDGGNSWITENLSVTGCFRERSSVSDSCYETQWLNQT